MEPPLAAQRGSVGHHGEHQQAHEDDRGNPCPAYAAAFNGSEAHVGDAGRVGQVRDDLVHGFDAAGHDQLGHNGDDMASTKEDTTPKK